jgi:hypothetical protein
MAFSRATNLISSRCSYATLYQAQSIIRMLAHRSSANTNSSRLTEGENRAKRGRSPTCITTPPPASDFSAEGPHSEDKVKVGIEVPLKGLKGSSNHANSEREHSGPDAHKERTFLKVELNFGRPIGLTTDPALRVVRLAPGGQAALRGVKAGMRVIAVGGRIVSTDEQLHLAVQECRRGGKTSDCHVLFLNET